MAVNNSLAKKPVKMGLTAYLSQDAVKKQINNVVGGKNGTRFISSIVSATQATPALQECTNPSILSAALLGEALNLYLPRLKKRLYKGMNLEDGKDKELYKEYSPAMRDEAFRRGLEEYKREIEFNVGLAYGDLSDAQEVDKTATEVLASKTRKYNRVTAIQEKLEECLNGFVNALAFYNGSYTSGVEFTCEFNDSILADEESERQQDRQDVSMGVMSLVEYRMKWYNEDEETAKSKIPEQNQVME